MRVRLRCDNSYCNRYFFANKSIYRNEQYKFCKRCKKFHSYKVLVHQVTFNRQIEDYIIELSQVFRTPYALADALVVSPPTLYRWLRHYFRMNFQEFRLAYILKRRESVVRSMSLAEHRKETCLLAPFDFRSRGVDRNGVNYDIIKATAKKVA